MKPEKNMTSKQFREMLIRALDELLDGGLPFKIFTAPNDREFFYTDDDGNAFRIHVSQLMKRGER